MLSVKSLLAMGLAGVTLALPLAPGTCESKGPADTGDNFSFNGTATPDTHCPCEGDIFTEGHMAGGARIWTTVDRRERSGKLDRVAIHFQRNFFENAPKAGPDTPFSDHKWNFAVGPGVTIPCCGYENILALQDDNQPQNDRYDLPFSHVQVNWNPYGHPNNVARPADAFYAPHFDFHFTVMSCAQREAMYYPGADDAEFVASLAEYGSCLADAKLPPLPPLVTCESWKKQLQPVDERLIQKDRVRQLQSSQGGVDIKNLGEVAPGMGNHLINICADEFWSSSRNDEPAEAEFPAPSLPESCGKDREFTHTWIFGAYEGKLAYYEPMITQAVFEGYTDDNAKDCYKIPVGKYANTDGYWPTIYCIGTENGDYFVSLERFQFKQGIF
jgi:hypothetical protein